MREQPEVRLRPMTATEFASWREIAIELHSAQTSRATGQDLPSATADSQALLARFLPEGLATDQMHLFVITDRYGQIDVGWLWLGPSPADPNTGHVFDIIVHPDLRGQGYGRATMIAAEEVFLAHGKSRIGLNVAGGNDVAQRLYESLGYAPVTTAMVKHLSGKHGTEPQIS
jgi:ribosomal protein S18 acetylase RimI-like enzyme